MAIYTHLGDTLQLLNPLVVMCTTSNRQEFGMLYLQAMGIDLAIKHLGKRTHFRGSMRPNGSNYAGMPSGHTASAWVAASYSRNPIMYLGGVITAHSRVWARKHSWGQVIGGALLGEAVVWLHGNYAHKHVRVMLRANGVSVVWRL